MRVFQLDLVLGLALTLFSAPSFSVQAGPIALNFPLKCADGQTCLVQNYVDADPGHAAVDYLCGAQTYGGHNGVDIRISDLAAQRRGVEVVAAAPGVVLRLRDGVSDLLIRAPGAPSILGQECGNGLIIDHGAGWETQYCHMANGSPSVRVGQRLVAGTVLGRVGLSGATEFPHLHLTVRYQGRVVDPFTPGLPGSHCSPIMVGDLWTPAARHLLAYRAGAVLNSGFSSQVMSMEAVEEGRLTPPELAAPFLVAYVRAIHLKAGDIQVLSVTGPLGAALASSTSPALGRDQAQSLTYVGLRRPETGWKPGTYTARYKVMRLGHAVVSQTFSTKF